MYYLFTRKITKKEAINKYGKLGFNMHLEGIYIIADNVDEAYEKLEPFNYKKHIKFTFDSCIYEFKGKLPDIERIIDLGIVE